MRHSHGRPMHQIIADVEAKTDRGMELETWELLYKKLNALRLEVDGSIVDDIKKTVDSLFDPTPPPQMDGVSLIAQERHEQKTKHGYTDEFQAQNPQYYSNGQLIDAAHYALTLHGWPASWENIETKERIAQKSYRDRLIVAGALIAAELDRLQVTRKIQA